MADLELRRVSKRFGGVTAVADIDLEIAHREFVVIVGPSGCGKSTLLRVIAGLEELTTGEIHVGGEAVHRTPPAKRGIAFTTALASESSRQARARRSSHEPRRLCQGRGTASPGQATPPPGQAAVRNRLGGGSIPPKA